MSQVKNSRFFPIILMILALIRFTLLEIAPKLIPVSIIFFSSCADERPPTGGTRDSLPPKVTYSRPENKSLNFQTEKIKIGFQEYIQQNLDPKEIVISPPMETKPKFQVNGKNLTISIKSKLKKNTTYTINFGDAIKDNNEGNIFKNFTYVFATGPILDTASISGTVTNVASPQELENILVCLYPIDSIDGIKISKPYYFAKTDRNGNYVINNIHSGTYNIFGLKDQNLNYKYDQSDELIGFIESPITLSDSSKSKMNLSVFLSINNKPKLVDATSTSPGKIVLAYNSPIKRLIIQSRPLPRKDIIEFNTQKDSVNYWFSNIYDQKIYLSLVNNDSVTDSATIDLKGFNKDSINNDKKYSLSVESHIFKNDSSGKAITVKPILSPFKPIILSLSRPVDSINKIIQLELVNDTTKKRDIVSFTLNSITKRLLTVSCSLVEKNSYTLIIPDSTFLDIFGWWNKKILYKWTTDANENYGNMILNLKFDDPEKNYVLKIIDADNQVIETYTFNGLSEKKVDIRNIKAGIYHLQAIYDTNKNGNWDSGDFSKRIQPEKLINFRESYEIKGSWDLEIDLKL